MCEGEWDLVPHIRMTCTLHHPCIACLNWVVNPMVGVGDGDQCTSFNICFDNVLHNFIFDKPVSFHFRCMHVMSCSSGYESPHQPINSTTSKPFGLQREPSFQCPMTQLNGSLYVLVWMWDLSKTHHPQIYEKLHAQIHTKINCFDSIAKKGKLRFVVNVVQENNFMFLWVL